MRADRLSSGITPWDNWYHAMALAKLDLGGGAACERRSVQRPGHGGASPEKVGQWRPFPSAQGLPAWLGDARSTLVMAGGAVCSALGVIAVLRVVSQNSIGIDPGGRIAAFGPRLLRSHRNEENPSIGSAAMSLRLPDR